MKNVIQPLALVLACAVVAGCASQTRTEAEFGDSVRAMTTHQIYDMDAAMFPSKDAVTGGDADQLEAVINAHKGQVSEAQQVQKPISLQMGSGTSR